MSSNVQVVMKTHTTTKVTRTICTDSDGRNRQFIYTLYADGSAMSREIVRHCSDAARRTQCAYRERHDAGSEMAILINRLAAAPALPAGWYESAA